MEPVSQPAMIENSGPFARFAAACEREQVDFTPIAYLATMGGSWHLYAGRSLTGYVAAMEAASGGSSLTESRRYPVTYWTTPPGLSQLASWDLALAFITARVRDDLLAEWGE